MSGLPLGEILFAGSIATVGAIVLRVGLKALGLTLTVLLSGIVGVLVLAITTIVPLIIGRPNGTVIVAAIAFALMVVFVVVETRRSTIAEGVIAVTYAFVTNAAVAGVIGVLLAPILTYDSWRFLEYGSSAFGDGTPIGDLMGVFGSYPIALTSVEGMATSLGMPFAASTVAAFGVLAVTGAFDALAPQMEGLRRGWRVLMILAVVLGVAASAYTTRIQLSYVNSHALAAGYYTLGVAALFAPGLGSHPSPNGTENIRAFLLGISCGGIALARVEGLLIAGLLLAVAVTYRGWSRRSLWLIALLAVLGPGLWYARLALSDVSTAILSPPRMVVLLGVAAAPLVIAMASRANHPVSWLAPTALSLVAIAIIFVAWDRSSDLGTSAGALGLNLVAKGLWGATWWVVIPIALVAVTRLGEGQAMGGWLVLTFGFVLLVVLLGGVRDIPYREGWGDSANRMMVHVLPTFFLLVFYSFKYGDRSVSTRFTRGVAGNDPTAKAVSEVSPEL